MIILSSFQCDQSRNSRRFSCDVTHEKLPANLFFDCKGNNLPTVDDPSCNWAAVAMLHPAMAIGEDLVIEGPVTPELLFALNGDVQSLILANQTRLHRIRVVAKSHTPAQSATGTDVATAFSAGIDCLATMDIYSRQKAPAGMGITTLTMFNVGAMGDTEKSKSIFHKYCLRLEKFAQTFGYNWASVHSNLRDFYIGKISSIVNTAVIRNSACAFLFEDQLKTYLYSSSVPYRDIRTSDWGQEGIEPMLLSLLSTENMQIVSAGAGLSRVEKTRLVCEMDIARDYLDVCIGDPDSRAAAEFLNCGTCPKCVRTFITLDILGRLDDFAKTSDLEKFKSTRAKAIRKVFRYVVRKNVIDAEVVRFMYESNYKGMPVWMKFLCLLGFAKARK